MKGISKADLNTKEAHCDIAIAGGGMVGLSLALMLARCLPHLNITLVEGKKIQAGTPALQESFDMRSTAISANSEETLRQLGIWHSEQLQATPIHHVQVSDQGQAFAMDYHKRDNEALPLGYVVDNDRLGLRLNTLCLQSKNIRTIAPAKVTDSEPTRYGMRLSLTHIEDASSASVTPSSRPHTINCRLLVVADGAESALRKRMGISTKTHNYHQHALIANVQANKEHEGWAYERFTPSGPAALLPRGGDVSSDVYALVWTRSDAQLDQDLNSDDKSFLSRLQEIFPRQVGSLVHVGQRAHYPLKKVEACEQVRRSLVLMGNAAHYLHPVAGQGFNLALRDCRHLISAIQKAQNDGEALGELDTLLAYQKAQEGDQWRTTYLSHYGNSLFSSSHVLAKLSRQSGLLAMGLQDKFRDTFFQTMMGRGGKLAKVHVPSPVDPH